MWKYRGELIFTLALAFAVKALARPEAVAVAGLVLFLAAHYVDRFFSAERAEKRLEAKIAALEQEIRDVKQESQRLNLAVGIRGLK